MSLVNAETGELTVLLTKDEAEQLTAKIKSYAGVICQLVKEAHDKQAWRAMGYGTWAAYCKAEFDYSRSYSYRLIGHVNKLLELSAAAGIDEEVSPMGDTLTERATRDLDMDQVTEAVREAVRAIPADADVSTRADLVNEIIAHLPTNEAAEPGQGSALDPAPVPDTSTDAPSPPDDELVDGTGGPAAPGATPGPDDATAAVSEPPADEPERVALPAPAVTTPIGWDWNTFLVMTPAQAVKVVTDADELAYLDDVWTAIQVFFAARKEMAA